LRPLFLRRATRAREARAVETVSANSLINQLPRSGVARGSFGERAVKGSVKNGKLRLGFAEKLPRHANAGEVARVVQRCERDAAFDRGFHISSHAPRFTKLSATMNKRDDRSHQSRSLGLQSWMVLPTAYATSVRSVPLLSCLHPCSRLRCLLRGERCL
jgi:hypothetical protein